MNASGSRGATTSVVMLIEPNHFTVNAQAGDNIYMGVDVVNSALAMQQHRKVQEALVKNSIQVKLFEGLEGMPDAVFPNNSFATTRDGKAILGVMHVPNRKDEKYHPAVNEWLREEGYEVVDLADSRLRPEDSAELTGSLIIDHKLNSGFVGLSRRCTYRGAYTMGEIFDLDELHVFPLSDSEYHTNVVLSILGGDIVVVAPSGFQDPVEAERIAERYDHVVVLSEKQKNNFAGNVLALGDNKVFLSARAHASLLPRQSAVFKKAGYELVSVDISELEKGGGSMRCLLCEIWPIKTS